MAVNPLLVGAGAVAAWLLTRKAAPVSGQTPQGDGHPDSGGAPPVSSAQNAANVLQIAINTGTLKTLANRLPVQQSQPDAAPAPVAGIGPIIAVSGIGAANWEFRLNEYPGWPGAAFPYASYYWKVRQSINSFLDDAVAQIPGANAASQMEYPTFSRDGVAVNPLDGLGDGLEFPQGLLRGRSGFSGFGAVGGELATYTISGVSQPDLLKIILAGIYSAIEEVWAYNSSYRKFLQFRRFSQADQNKEVMTEDAFWQYVGTLMGARIVVGEEWNSGVDLKYGDSGVNLHELGYSWLENWASSTLGTGANALAASSHAVGGAIAICQAARQGYQPTWPGDAQYTNTINANTVGWAPVGTTLIQDPASGLRIDVVKSREQNKPVVFVPT